MSHRESRAKVAMIRLSALLAALGLGLLSCARSGAEQSHLQADDLVSSSGAFDETEIVRTAELVDFQALDVDQVQRFLSKTAYGRASFLATYQSNGIRAADAIAAVSQKYNLNPIVFLVRAEMAEGLVGEQFYPSPPSRVEYVFRCGCGSAGSCDPALAGFDVQVDCFGRTLRTSLDEIAATGTTAGGWGPNVTSTAVDGERITPRDEATAALYQYEPKVGVGASGNWLFWNIWQKYAVFLQYSGPVGPGPGQGAWVGDACKADATCGFPGALCATNYPGGLCTAACTADCPSSPNRAATFCASFQQSGYCLPICNPGVASSCRDGYSCKSVQRFGSTTESQPVCVAN